MMIHHIQRDFAPRYRFPMLNISQFYPRPNTPAAKLKRLDGQTVKARSSEMTQLFESYSTWDHLVGATKKVPGFFMVFHVFVIVFHGFSGSFMVFHGFFEVFFKRVPFKVNSLRTGSHRFFR